MLSSAARYPSWPCMAAVLLEVCRNQTFVLGLLGEERDLSYLPGFFCFLFLKLTEFLL